MHKTFLFSKSVQKKKKNSFSFTEKKDKNKSFINNNEVLDLILPCDNVKQLTNLTPEGFLYFAAFTFPAFT